MDGHERDILNGIGQANICRLESALIEFNGEDKKFGFKGFTTDNDFNKHPQHTRHRRNGNPENVIFVREYGN